MQDESITGDISSDEKIEFAYDYRLRQPPIALVKSSGFPAGNFDNQTCKPDVAVQVHIFYLDLVDEMISYLNNIPIPFDCFVSTDSFDKKEFIEFSFRSNCKAVNVFVGVFPNRGRDLAPFLMQMHDVIGNYELIGHFHTKKSETAPFGKQWRHYLLRNLLGSKEFVATLFGLFEQDANLGLITPETYPLVRMIADWSGSENMVSQLFERMQLEIDLPDVPIFPAGSMFWARCRAVTDLFKLDLRADDFSEEAGQTNFTLAHAIERIWILLAQANKFTYRLVQNVIDKPAQSYASTIRENEHCRDCFTIFAITEMASTLSERSKDTLRLLARISSVLTVVSTMALDEDSINYIQSLGGVYRRKKFFESSDASPFNLWARCFNDSVLRSNSARILCLDDSLIGPFSDLSGVIEYMANNADFWGAFYLPRTQAGPYDQLPPESKCIFPHFIVFEPSALSNNAVEHFFAKTAKMKSISNIEKMKILTRELSEVNIHSACVVEESLDFEQWLHHNEPFNYFTLDYVFLASPFIAIKAIDNISDAQRNALLHYVNQLGCPSSFARCIREGLDCNFQN